MGFASTISSSEELCETVQLAQAICCPADDSIPPNNATITEATAAISTIAAAAAFTTTSKAPININTELVDGLCSCSPVEYKFELNLNQDCDAHNDIDGNPGIGLTFCTLDSTLANANKERNGDIVITYIQFLEFDTSGNLIVINQDDTSYFNTSHVSGDIVTFRSISNDLDPDVPMEDQLDYLPGGVQLTLQGRLVEGGGAEDEIVSNRITWSYTNACDAEPLAVGERIGWLTVDNLQPASGDFCSARNIAATEATASTTEAPAKTTEVPATTTVAPATTTDPPATTTDPPATTTTQAPDTTIAALTTDTPALPTEAPPDMSMPMLGKAGKSSKHGKAKSSKSKTVKTKVQKVPKNPMAKAVKQSDADDDESTDDAKSGKARVDFDAKADKKTSGDSGGKAEKNAKSAKSSSVMSDEGHKGHKIVPSETKT